MSQPKSRQARTRKPSEPAALEILSFEQIEQADDLPTMDVPIPEWGENKGVRIRRLTKRQHSDVRKLSTKNGVLDEDLLSLNGIAESLVEPKLTTEQVQALMQKSQLSVERIESAMLELNGLTSEALAALEATFRAAA
jgi:hypothetical protein